MKTKLLALALLLCGVATAQNPHIAVVGAEESANGVVVNIPQTALTVDLVVECDRTVSGPYARYSQKYLGVRAPLSDRTVWSIRRAEITLSPASPTTAAAPATPSVKVFSHLDNPEAFTRLQPDKTDMITPTLEDAARAAAQQIFSLRRHRIELITGEAGENVFGEGLNSALREIERLEQSYLELFLGKQIVTTETVRKELRPQIEKRQYIIGRFSPTAGLLPESDLTGEVVLLQIEPSGAGIGTELEAGPKETSVVRCRVADPATCTVSLGSQQLGEAVLPLFEFGRTINVALPRRK